MKDKEKTGEDTKWRLAVSSSLNAIAFADLDGNLTYVNRSFLELWGYEDEEEVLGRSALSFWDSPARADAVRQASLAGGSWRGELTACRKDGSPFAVQLSANLLTDEEGKPMGKMASFTDITGRKETEKLRTRYQESLEQQVAERTTALTRQTALLHAINRVFRESLTRETEEEVARVCLAVAEELTGSRFGFICRVNDNNRLDTVAISDTGWSACRIPKTEALILANDLEVRGIRGLVITDNAPLIVNEPASHPDFIAPPEGHPQITSFLGVPFRHGGEVVGAIGLANKDGGYGPDDRQDIEALSMSFMVAVMRMRAEEQVRTSLEEKEVLLKEIHHRVKNNLQVISSLLNLQSNIVGDEKVEEMFRESRNRVRSMALSHEQLYQSEGLARVDFGRYIRDLAGTLFRSYGADPAAVRLTVDVADVSLALDTAIPCGLMVNELVSNCLKHAFPDGGAGEILIRLVSDDDARHTLAVRDNGVGFPEDTDHRTSPTLGLQLVSSLADQLGGTIELDRSEGTEFRISFGG